MAAWGWNQTSAIPTGKKEKRDNVVYGWLTTQQKNLNTERLTSQDEFTFPSKASFLTVKRSLGGTPGKPKYSHLGTQTTDAMHCDWVGGIKSIIIFTKYLANHFRATTQYL